MLLVLVLLLRTCCRYCGSFVSHVARQGLLQPHTGWTRHGRPPVGRLGRSPSGKRTRARERERHAPLPATLHSLPALRPGHRCRAWAGTTSTALSTARQHGTWHTTSFRCAAMRVGRRVCAHAEHPRSSSPRQRWNHAKAVLQIGSDYRYLTPKTTLYRPCGTCQVQVRTPRLLVLARASTR